eukprot:11033133-Lingulodinium_polyedra.AAC.1
MQGKAKELAQWREAVQEWKQDNGIDTEKPHMKAAKMPKTLNLASARKILPKGATLFESSTEGRCRGFFAWQGRRLSCSYSLKPG